MALVLGETFPPQELPRIDLDILEDDDLISLESNEIAGVISLYGLPAAPAQVGEFLSLIESLRGQLQEPIRPWKQGMPFN